MFIHIPHKEVHHPLLVHDLLHSFESADSATPLRALPIPTHCGTERSFSSCVVVHPSSPILTWWANSLCTKTRARGATLERPSEESPLFVKRFRRMDKTHFGSRCEAQSGLVFGPRRFFSWLLGVRRKWFSVVLGSDGGGNGVSVLVCYN